MKRLLLISVAVGALVAGCNAADNTVSPLRTSIGPPSFELTDCQMHQTWQCIALQAGIDRLKGHQLSHCAAAGNSAQARFDDYTGETGFRRGDGTAFLMYVEMIPGTSQSGWVPHNGYIHVTDHFWNSGYGSNTDSVSVTIAHEEGGHMTGDDDPDHNFGAGEYYNNSCKPEN